jgi:MFS family permease
MKRGLRVLLVADACINLALGMIGPIYAIFVEEIGGDILDASWAYFAFTFSSGVIIYAISKWEDHTQHKEKLVVVGYALTALGALGYSFVHTQTQLVLVQVVLGIATAILSPAFDAVYAHYVSKGQETSNWGAWEGMGYIVAAIAALAGGYLVSQFGFNALFLVMFVMAIAGTIVSLGLFRGEAYLNLQAGQTSSR